MKTMKSLLLWVMVLGVLVPVTQAGLSVLPESEYFSGISLFNTGTITGYIDYAVYDTDTQILDGYNSDNGRFVYAYQIFHTGGATIDAISILGFNPDGITSQGVDESDTLDGVTTVGAGVWASGLNAESTSATWIFEDGVLIENEDSIFLLMYSDYDIVAGTYEINPTDNGGSIIVEGEELGGDNTTTPVPEPATLALLLGGTILSLKRRKQQR